VSVLLAIGGAMARAAELPAFFGCPRPVTVPAGARVRWIVTIALAVSGPGMYYFGRVRL
jgi:hypothetical protein